jgi:hypothetical protein
MSQNTRELVAELGEQLGLPTLLADDEDLAVLNLENSPPISLSIDDDEAVVLAALLGKAPEGKAELAEELLASNLFWRDTGGATLSMERYGRDVFLARRWAPSELPDSGALAKALEGFADLAVKWVVVLERLAAPDGGSDQAEHIPTDLLNQRA